jgi:mannose-1-phosphate guanylyltransferase
MLPAAGVPFVTHLLARARDAGVTHAILSTSYRAEVFEEHFGDGTSLGLDLEYVWEPEPLGTGGGIRHVADRLRDGPKDPVLIFNGDVLSGLDIAGLLAAHEESGAEVSLYLTRVDDPRAFGLVPTDETGAVTAFLEKPSRPQDIVTDQVNAGCYVFQRRVVDRIPAGRAVSVERETFPGLLAEGARVTGVVDPAYWLDLGTPAAFVRGSCDLVLGMAPSPALPGPTGQRLLLPRAAVDPSATVAGGTTVGAGARVGPGACVDGSVVFDAAVVGDGAVVRSSVVGRGAIVGAASVLDAVVVGDGARVGAHNELRAGARVWVDALIPDAAIRFSSDR